MRTTCWFPLVALVSTGLPGCGGDFEEPTAHVRKPVVGGVPSPEEHNSIMMLQGERACTASLVAPNLMLTARHCVSDFDDGTYTCDPEGIVDPNQPRIPSSAGSIGSTLPPEEIKFFMGQEVLVDDEPVATGVRVFAPTTDTICRNDIALVQIEPEIDLPRWPIRLYEGTFPGDPMLVSGYGLNGENNLLTRNEREVTVDKVGESEYYPVVGRATVRAFTVGQSVCQGDSGGPAISDRGAIAGVFSLVNFDCMSSLASNTFTQVAAFQALVETAFEEAGYEPLLEEPAGEGGGAGAASDSTGGSGGSGAGGSGGSETGGSGGSDTSGTGGASKPPSNGACVCRAAGPAPGGAAWFAVVALVGAALGRRPGKNRPRRA